MGVIIPYLTVSILVSAFILSAINILVNLKQGTKISKDFNSLLLLLTLGWMPSEVISDLIDNSSVTIPSMYHLLITIIISLILTLRWKWAIKEAMNRL